MMQVWPVIPADDAPVIIDGKEVPMYGRFSPLKMTDGIVVTRWRCNWADRLRVLILGNVYLYQGTLQAKMDEHLPPAFLTTLEPREKE